MCVYDRVDWTVAAPPSSSTRPPLPPLMERVRKIKRQLSMTLRGGNSGDKTMTESISSQDAGAHSDSGTAPHPHLTNPHSENHHYAHFNSTLSHNLVRGMCWYSVQIASLITEDMTLIPLPVQEFFIRKSNTILLSYQHKESFDKLVYFVVWGINVACHCLNSVLYFLNYKYFTKCFIYV